MENDSNITGQYITVIRADHMTAIEVHTDGASVAFTELDGTIDYSLSMGFYGPQLIPIAKALIKAWFAIQWHRLTSSPE